jgi:hypothetical protein
MRKLIISAIILLLIVVGMSSATKVSVRCNGDVQLRINQTDLLPNTYYTIFLDSNRFSAFTTNSLGRYVGTHEAIVPEGNYDSIIFRSAKSSFVEYKNVVVKGKCGFSLGSFHATTIISSEDALSIFRCFGMSCYHTQPVFPPFEMISVR